MDSPDISELLDEIDTLREAVDQEALAIANRWTPWIDQEDFVPSARNFAQYLAFRHHDIRPLQRQLMSLGLSSLGRAEARVMPALNAVRNVLNVLNGTGTFPFPPDP